MCTLFGIFGKTIWACIFLFICCAAPVCSRSLLVSVHLPSACTHLQAKFAVLIPAYSVFLPFKVLPLKSFVKMETVLPFIFQMLNDDVFLCVLHCSTLKLSTMRHGLSDIRNLSQQRRPPSSGPSQCPYLPLEAFLELCQPLWSSEYWEGELTHLNLSSLVHVTQKYFS